MFVCIFSILSLGDCDGRKQVRGECKVERWINSLDELLLIIAPRTESMKTKNWSTSQSQTAAASAGTQKYYSMIMEFFTFLCRIPEFDWWKPYASEGGHNELWKEHTSKTSYRLYIFSNNFNIRDNTRIFISVRINTLKTSWGTATKFGKIIVISIG